MQHIAVVSFTLLLFFFLQVNWMFLMLNNKTTETLSRHNSRTKPKLFSIMLREKKKEGGGKQVKFRIASEEGPLFRT